MSPVEDHRSDADLLAAIVAREAGAFEVLYYRHRDWVYRLAFRFSENAEDAQDVVQEVFVYLVRSAGRIKLQAKLTTLLYPAVKHTAVAIRRKRRRMGGSSSAVEADLVAPVVGPDAVTERRELAEVLSEIPETHREILLIRFVDDFTLEEIAAALEIPLGTAKSRLHHAVKHLQADGRARRYFEPP